MKPRVPLFALLVLVVPIALGIAALKNPCVLWASTLFTLLVVVLLVTTLGALQTRSEGLRGFSRFG